MAIKLRRGNKADLQVSELQQGEPVVALDTKEFGIKGRESDMIWNVPTNRLIAGINLQDDILLSELIAAGLAAGTGGAANNALALGGVDAQSIIDPGHTAESNGYTKLQNGIIIEWLKYNTPVVTANTIYGADITPTHIQNVLCAIGSVIPDTAWDFGPAAVFNLGTEKISLTVKSGATAQTFTALIVAIGI